MKIKFETELFTIGDQTILHLPSEASALLPSRGAIMAEGTINGHTFRHPLEPDGRKGHWMPVDATLARDAGIADGDTVQVELTPTKDWPDPELPADIRAAFEADPEAHELFMACTPMARWEWIRWIRATNNPATRGNHIVVAISKLKGGHRRPCCFNSSACTDFTVSKNGVLLQPIRS